MVQAGAGDSHLGCFHPAVLWAAAAAAVSVTASTCAECSPEKIPSCIQVDGKEAFSHIIVGGGTAGCLTAYLQAKWMQDRRMMGNVLLVERGEGYTPDRGPNPKMEGWYDNWGIFGEAHAAVREDGSYYPVTGTDHRGLGGCGTHDTRITFQPTKDKKKELASAMGWSLSRINTYYQAALNMMPIERAILQPEQFYADVITSLTKPSSDGTPPLKRVKDDNYNTEIVVDSVAENALAMFPDEQRWTSALLLHDEVRPANLIVLTTATADRVLIEHNSAGNEIFATGVIVRDADNAERLIKLDEGGLLAVTGGAIGTPAILQRSGVGPRRVLRALGIDVKVDNDEVGHGVDHPEIGLMYAWNKDIEVPRGGAMGWPLSLFLATPPDETESIHGTHERNSFVQCHFGAGVAEPYTDADAVVCTPSCTEPDHGAGFRVQIVSKDPLQSTELIHAEQTADMNALYDGLIRAVEVCSKLQIDGLAGARIKPPSSLDLSDKNTALAWIRDNHFTVYHWSSTCPAGIHGRVADNTFRVLREPNTGSGSQGVVKNLYIGSAASLPDLPEANPHLTVSAFSFALAKSMHKEMCDRRGVKYVEPVEFRQARQTLSANGAELRVVRRGKAVPDLSSIAAAHGAAWARRHQSDDNSE